MPEPFRCRRSVDGVYLGMARAGTRTRSQEITETHHNPPKVAAWRARNCKILETKRCPSGLVPACAGAARVGSDSSMTKAAFEVRKGPQEVLSLSDADVAQYLDPGELLLEMETSF